MIEKIKTAFDKPIEDFSARNTKIIKFVFALLIIGIISCFLFYEFFLAKLNFSVWANKWLFVIGLSCLSFSLPLLFPKNNMAKRVDDIILVITIILGTLIVGGIILTMLGTI